MSHTHAHNDKVSPVKTITDEQILGFINSELNVEQGYRLLMEKYQEKLYWHLRRMVNQHEDADDILQNTFIKVFKSIRSFEGKSKLYTWLYRIATNEAITFINRKKRMVLSSIDTEENIVAYSLKAEDYLDPEFIQQKLKAALDLLPDKQRLVFNMRYYDEMSYKDISEVLSTSIGALKASYHHAVKKIEQYITDDEYHVK